MFVLQVINGPYKGQAVALKQGEVISIGRSPECTVCFDDPQLSARHVEVDWSDQGFSVFDLGSSNGTYVDGQRISGRVGLTVGAHLQLGQALFVLTDIDLETEQVDLIDTDTPSRGQMLAISGASTQIAPIGGVTIANVPSILQAAAQKTAMQPRVAEVQVDDRVLSKAAKLKDVVLSGGQGAKVLVQRDGRLDPFWAFPVSLGRDHSSGIVLDDSSVSLRHAVVDHREGRHVVRDVGSSNGTFVNGERIVDHVLQDGDILSVGSYAMVVVIGSGCLGLDLQPPAISQPQRTPSGKNLGVIRDPLAEAGSKKKKRKKKASELVWYATSDLDRGVFRGRAALVALVLGVVFTGWMLNSGSSEILAGNPLSAPHESARFTDQATALGRDQCTSCHIGAGRTATVLCLDCHPNSRPSEGHVSADIECLGCHLEHRGSEYRSADAATLDCARCHAVPHETLARERPQLVATFDRDAVADVQFHLVHDAKKVKCLDCHDLARHTAARGIRGTCGGCHAPEHPAAADCQLCHATHPDRTQTGTVVAAFPPTMDPPRFAGRALLWGLALLIISFLFAALIPRKRKVAIESPSDLAA